MLTFFRHILTQQCKTLILLDEDAENNSIGYGGGIFPVINWRLRRDNGKRPE